MFVFRWLLLIGLVWSGAWAQTPASGDAVPASGVDGVRRPVATDAAAAAGRVVDPRSALGQASGQAAPLGSLVGVNTDYRIGANDLIDVEVFGVPDLKRTARVNSSGQMSLPLIGSVALAGLTAQEAEELIAKRYAEKYLQKAQWAGRASTR
jgi:polysaccharide biosynthesis/export protein